MYTVLSRYKSIAFFVLVHYTKIIHRDIKPTNLLLDKNDHIKVGKHKYRIIFASDVQQFSNSLSRREYCIKWEVLIAADGFLIRCYVANGQ